MNVEVTLRSFVGWIVAGMGFHIGWGLISLLVEFAAKAVSK